MNTIKSEIAHVSFRGGGIFLPARNPYDRQVLLEHVAARVRTSGQVQVLLDGQRWMVHLSRSSGATNCACCGANLDAACCPTTGGAASCMRCALLSRAHPSDRYREFQRYAG